MCVNPAAYRRDRVRAGGEIVLATHFDVPRLTVCSHSGFDAHDDFQRRPQLDRLPQRRLAPREDLDAGNARRCEAGRHDLEHIHAGRQWRELNRSARVKRRLRDGSRQPADHLRRFGRDEPHQPRPCRTLQCFQRVAIEPRYERSASAHENCSDAGRFLRGNVDTPEVCRREALLSCGEIECRGWQFTRPCAVAGQRTLERRSARDLRLSRRLRRRFDVDLQRLRKFGSSRRAFDASVDDAGAPHRQRPPHALPCRRENEIRLRRPDTASRDDDVPGAPGARRHRGARRGHRHLAFQRRIGGRAEDKLPAERHRCGGAYVERKINRAARRLRVRNGAACKEHQRERSRLQPRSSIE